MGYFNLDLLQYHHHSPTQEFINSLFSHMFLPLFSNPTCLTSYSAMLIDNIFTNHPSKNVLNGIMLNDLSDHLPVFAYFHDELLPPNREKLFKHSFNESNLKKFNESLSQTNWSTILNEEDPNESYNGFINEFSRLFRACCPLNIIKGNQLNKFRPPF